MHMLKKGDDSNYGGCCATRILYIVTRNLMLCAS
jgi:hypothetical protein